MHRGLVGSGMGIRGGHNGVHHIVFRQVHIHLHAARRAGGAGQRQNERAVFLFEHPVVKFGG